MKSGLFHSLRFGAAFKGIVIRSCPMINSPEILLRPFVSHDGTTKLMMAVSALTGLSVILLWRSTGVAAVASLGNRRACRFEFACAGRDAQTVSVSGGDRAVSAGIGRTQSRQPCAGVPKALRPGPARCQIRVRRLGEEARPAAKKPLPAFIVAAEGGGIRAAAMTAIVLKELSLRNPKFADHLFAIVGVSGGSVGAATYAAALAQGWLRQDAAAGAPSIPPNWENTLQAETFSPRPCDPS
ncbi:hypothetical protein ACVIGA_000617 [Bradyrhizobium sp. USDA 3240]